jgi:hypothetical protein
MELIVTGVCRGAQRLSPGRAVPRFDPRSGGEDRMLKFVLLLLVVAWPLALYRGPGRRDVWRLAASTGWKPKAVARPRFRSKSRAAALTSQLSRC